MKNRIEIKAFETQRVYKDAVILDDAKKYEFDFSVWAENNDEITSVAYEIEKGAATISDEALTDNIGSALITYSQTGRTLIKITAVTAEAIIYNLFLDVLVKDPTLDYTQDAYC